MKVIYGKKSIRKKDVIFVSDIDFQIPFGIDSLGIPIDILNEIEKSTVMGKSIPDLFAYEDFSLWWFMHPTIYPKIKQFINFIMKFNEFLEKEKPTKIKIHDDFTTFDIIKQICKNKNIKFEFSMFRYSSFRISNMILQKLQKYRYEKITRMKINNRKILFNKKNIPISSIKKKIIFAIPSTYRRHILNLKSSKSEKGEYIQQTIMDLIEDNEALLGIDIDYTFRGDTKTLSERLESNFSWVPLEILINKNQKKSMEHKEFLKKYKQIISNNNFKALFTYNGICLWKQLEFLFNKMTYFSYLPYYLELFDSLLTIFQNEKPKAIFLPYETGPIALSFIIAAKKFKIKTIGLAHSIIYPKNPMYSYYRLRNQQDTLGFPIPDFTLVFGNSSKQALMEAGYPEEKFVVFGNAAFFNFDKYLEILKNTPLCQNYGVNKDKKIILFATQYLQEEYYQNFGKFNYDTQIWKYLLKNFAGSKDWIIILKPHPTENTAVYEKILKNFDAPNFKIIQGDLFGLIYISSVVISIMSGAMFDSICLKKPVIRVTFGDFKHGIPYEKFQVVTSTELDKLTFCINEVVNNNKISDKLKKNRVHFIKEQYNIPEEDPEKILTNLINR